ncbi:MAG TPA: hypothetical protein VMT19_09445 [Thermoanaerobaculaceae bacterium]|nr:hypothetical protein [Thermoanaerobaculaceae bacterium]
MIRTCAVVVAVAAFALAGPSFAGSNGTGPLTRSASPATDGGGGPSSPVFPARGARGGDTADEQFVTGEVVMTTPSEVVVHTAQGMQKFELGPQAEGSYVPVEGDTVRIGYVPEAGSARVTTVQQAANAAPAPATVIAEQTTPTVGMPGEETDTGSAPQTPPSTAAGTADTGMQSEATAQQPRRHSARLPNTASERPLLLLIGVLSLAAAAVVRLAIRA